MGQPGNVILNQLLNYLLFAENTSPDIVISHFGAGDLHTGQCSDASLLNNYNITYNDICEVWAKKIHNSNHEIDPDLNNEKNANFKPVTSKNNPSSIVKSCYERLTQFKSIVERKNAKFIGGFQSWIYSKEKLSQNEKDKLKNYYKYYQKIYSNIPTLCELFKNEIISKNNNDFILDLHSSFKNLDSNISHFGDVVHTLEPGDEKIADEYFNKILNLYEN